MKILYVEDNPDVVSSIQRITDYFGYKLLVADTYISGTGRQPTPYLFDIEHVTLQREIGDPSHPRQHCEPLTLSKNQRHNIYG